MQDEHLLMHDKYIEVIHLFAYSLALHSDEILNFNAPCRMVDVRALKEGSNTYLTLC